MLYQGVRLFQIIVELVFHVLERELMQKLIILSMGGGFHLCDLFNANSNSSLLILFRSSCCFFLFISPVCFIPSVCSVNHFSLFHISFQKSSTSLTEGASSTVKFFFTISQFFAWQFLWWCYSCLSCISFQSSTSLPLYFSHNC